VAFKIGRYAAPVPYNPYTRLDIALKSTSSTDFTADTVVMTLQSNGNVGFGGDTAPAEIIDVTGNINVTGVYKVDDVQVVGSQGAAVADATDAASVILRLNELLARCRAHGLIAI
jgi:hypothetical protein